MKKKKFFKIKKQTWHDSIETARLVDQYFLKIPLASRCLKKKYLTLSPKPLNFSQKLSRKTIKITCVLLQPESIHFEFQSGLTLIHILVDILAIY